MSFHHNVARLLPDLPRWVEVRDLMLSGDCEIFDLHEQGELSFIVRENNGKMVFVIGQPSIHGLQTVIRDLGKGGMVIAPQEQAVWLTSALQGWKRARIILHTLPNHQHLPGVNDMADFLDADTLHQLPIDSELLDELKNGAQHSKIAATWVDQQPVSFCYVASETEAWWDIAVDTLPEHRRNGYAALCVAHMIRYMYPMEKQPVWQAIADNPPSWRLAQKLGFEPIDELALFELDK